MFYNLKYGINDIVAYSDDDSEFRVGIISKIEILSGDDFYYTIKEGNIVEYISEDSIYRWCGNSETILKDSIENDQIPF